MKHAAEERMSATGAVG